MGRFSIPAHVSAPAQLASLIAVVPAQTRAATPTTVAAAATIARLSLAASMGNAARTARFVSPLLARHSAVQPAPPASATGRAHILVLSMPIALHRADASRTPMLCIV